ncbi:hypothetical protein HYW55_05775 [Candidatus Gottesmanbacteria bacterium]|nr:hypothetical protein [Candidatus Gottesmanbacteria bacterium]
MRKVLLFVFLLSFFLSPPPIFSAVTPTTSAISPQPSCDLCGWCNQAVNPKPSNWDACQACIAQPRGYYTVFGCFSTDPTGAPFVQAILTLVVGVAGGIAFLAFLAGAATVLTSTGNPEKLSSGKETIISSLIGLLLILFSIFLLRVVGVDVLQIPGFG